MADFGYVALCVLEEIFTDVPEMLLPPAIIRAIASICQVTLSDIAEDSHLLTRRREN